MAGFDTLEPIGYPLFFFFLILFLGNISFGQHTGIGTLNPTHTFHIKPSDPNSDPLRVEDLQSFISNTDSSLLIVDPDSGVVRLISINELIQVINSKEAGLNIYSINGTLNDDREVNLDDNQWTFIGTDTVTIMPDGTMGVGTGNPLEGLQVGDKLTFNSMDGFISSIRHNNYYDGTNLRYASKGPGAGIGLNDLGQIVFSTIPSGNGGEVISTQRTTLVIDQHGQVGIGTRSPGRMLDVVGDGQITGDLVISGTDSASDAYIQTEQISDQKVLSFGNGSENGYIGFDGTNDRFSLMHADLEVGGGIIISSDARLKRDIHDLKDPLILLRSLRGIQYYWNKETYPEIGGKNTLQVGFLAHEVERSFPSLVSENSMGFKSVNYLGFIPYLVDAVNIQDCRIERLKKSVEELEAENKVLRKLLIDLEGRVSRLEED